MAQPTRDSPFDAKPHNKSCHHSAVAFLLCHRATEGMVQS